MLTQKVTLRPRRQPTRESNIVPSSYKTNQSACRLKLGGEKRDRRTVKWSPRIAEPCAE
jgi:hypothetical protein